MSPYTTYIDTQSGGQVSAIQAQHPGKLADSLELFDDGDYIVIFPQTLREVFTPENFSQRFRLKQQVSKVKQPPMWAELTNERI